MPKISVWKYLLILWMTAVLVAGFLIRVPEIPILYETSRNLFFHVPMWFTMTVVFAAGLVFSIRYLIEQQYAHGYAGGVGDNDRNPVSGMCGLLTGSLWARFTWGTWWTFAEPKMNLSAMAMMIYVAYFISCVRCLRRPGESGPKSPRSTMSLQRPPYRSCCTSIPRQLPSLHPGRGRQSGFQRPDRSGTAAGFLSRRIRFHRTGMLDHPAALPLSIARNLPKNTAKSTRK
jgi:heme exporter protein C